MQRVIVSDCCGFARMAVIFPSEPSLTRYPVHGDALHPADAISDHVFPPCLISLGPADGAQAHVHPIDGVIFCEKSANYVVIFATSEPQIPSRVCKNTCQRGNRCPRPGTCPTPAPERRICPTGPEECLVCLRARSRAGRIRRLQGVKVSKGSFLLSVKRSRVLNLRRRTLTRLLPCAQTVSCRAHACPGGRGGGEAQLGAVSVVVTAEIGAWGTQKQRQNTTQDELQELKQMWING